MSDKIGVRIVLDADYYGNEIGDDEIIADEREHFASGEWAPYGVIVVKECECCGNVGEGEFGYSLWGCVVDANADNEGTFWDGDMIPDTYLREIAKELVGEAQDA